MELAISAGTAGTMHVIPTGNPVAPVAGADGWSLRSAERRFRGRYFRSAPVLPVESDSVLWKRIQGSAPGSPREYILRALADKTALSRSDAERMVFGSGLRKSERHRNYLKSDGLGFDSFIHSLAIPEFYPESYQWDGPTRSSVEMDWMDELESVVAECLSSKHARTLLIESFRRAEQKSLEEFAPAF